MTAGTLLVGLIAAATASCAGGNSGDRPDAIIYGEQCTPGGTFNLDGVRAGVLGTLNVHVNASGLVEVDTTAELLIALNVTQDGTKIHIVAEACSIQIPDVPIQGQDLPIRFEVPTATIESVADVSGEGVLSSATAACATVVSDPLTLVLGARFDPASIATAPLPTASDDGTFRFCPPSADTPCELAIGSNCACDQEGDGQAGATLNALNVPAVDLDQVYVALRTRFTLRGEVYSSDLMLGEIDNVLETSILGCRMASGQPCNSSAVGAVKNLNPMVTQQPGNPSTFRAVRVEPGTSCADIIARRDELFPR